GGRGGARRLQGEDEAVEGLVEEAVGVVGDARLLQAGQGRELAGGGGGLGLGVFLLAPADVAAGGTAGFGQGVADEQSGQAVEAVGGLLFGQAGVEEDRGGPLDRGERGGGHRRSRAEQRDDVRVGQPGGASGP